MLESVIRRADGRVHLVGHSFGGLVALAVALRNRVPLASLAIIEAPAVELLRARKEDEHYRAFRQMTDIYFAAFEDGNDQAIEAMVDFYGGAGTFAAWPPRVRAYAVETTPTNILDWASAYGFPLTAELLAQIDVATLVIRGGESHPAMQCANRLVSECMSEAKLATIEGAAHFMIATHANEVAGWSLSTCIEPKRPRSRRILSYGIPRIVGARFRSSFRCRKQPALDSAGQGHTIRLDHSV
jgi:pimeloyl-ACP methyl ester carboxylesterase